MDALRSRVPPDAGSGVAAPISGREEGKNSNYEKHKNKKKKKKKEEEEEQKQKKKVVGEEWNVPAPANHLLTT